MKTSTVLLVDDNPDHVELARRSLEDVSSKTCIRHVRDGRQALAYLRGLAPYDDRKENPFPDLVFLDLHLPEIGGLALLGRMKANRMLRSLPVVVLTSSACREDILTAYNLQANGYLVKPGDYTEFERMLKVAGQYWLDWNHQPGPEEK